MDGQIDETGERQTNRQTYWTRRRRNRIYSRNCLSFLLWHFWSFFLSTAEYFRQIGLNIKE